MPGPADRREGKTMRKAWIDRLERSTRDRETYGEE
jgi:hypothetical protein